MDHTNLSTALKEFVNLTLKPEDFLSCNTKTHDRFKTSTKLIYDFCKNCENKRQQDEALPELIVKHFDDEQIWQELELQNNSVVDKLLGNVVGLVTKIDSVNFLADGIEKQSKSRNKKTQKKDLMNDPNNEEEEEEEEEEESDETDQEIDKIKLRLEDSDDDIGDMKNDDDDDDDMDFDFDSINPIQYKNNDTSDDDDDDGKENVDEIDSDAGKKKKNKKKPVKGSIVDDKFFKLAEMEAFLEQEDAKEMKKQRQEEKGDESDDESNEEDIDLFTNFSPEDEEEEEAKYEDFFDPPNDEVSDKKKVKFKERTDEDEEDESADRDESDDDDDGGVVQGQKSDLLDSGSEGEDVNEIFGGPKAHEKSNFEKRQEKLKEKIKKMEDASLETKTWQLIGETTATTRPENSLLEEHLMFDHIAKIPKVITEETTVDIETMIKQRIKDKAWDDVERKVKPKENPFEYKKRIVLDQEKSKQSLGEIYEQEYLKQQQEEEEEKTDPDHDEIKKMMQSLFVKLDALSNFHYTPKPAAPEIKIVSNMPTIAMEEVAPVSVSENQILAPEEIKEKMKGELKAQTEKTETDRKRERRVKKYMKRKRQKERARREKLVQKLNPGLGNKYSKEKAMKELEKQSKAGKGVTMVQNTDQKKTKSSLTSSKSFFTQLQEEVTTQIKSKKADKRNIDKSHTVPSKKLKL